VGLLGDQWDGSCSGTSPLWSAHAPEIVSYGVGDFGPSAPFVAHAIAKSVQDGVDVINLSMAIAYSPLVEQHVRAAIESNVVVVAAAGNHAAKAAEKPARFPASIDGVIAVGAAGMSMRPSSFSADRGIDLLAPGEDIVVGGPDGAWYLSSGTSLAAPHVTAAAAMIRGVRPDLAPGEVLAVLQAAGTRGRNAPFLNVPAALDHVSPPATRPGRKLPTACGAPAGAGKNDVASAAGEEPGEDPGPAALTMLGNHPNPFNPSTVIRLSLGAPADVTLRIFDASGREVTAPVHAALDAGTHALRFDGTGLATGWYVYRVTAAGAVRHGHMLLIK
jgi:hypothetical protein